MDFAEVTARENICSRSSAGRARRWDLWGFVVKRSMVLCSEYVDGSTSKCDLRSIWLWGVEIMIDMRIDGIR